MIVKLFEKGNKESVVIVRYDASGMRVMQAVGTLAETAYSWFAHGSEEEFLKSLETIPLEYEIEITPEPKDCMYQKFHP